MTAHLVACLAVHGLLAYATNSGTPRDLSDDARLGWWLFRALFLVLTAWDAALLVHRISA